MTTELNWNEAPEGYPVWIQVLDRSYCSGGWHKDDGDRYVNPESRYWPKTVEGELFIAYRKPSIAWTGDGLPPVGNVCEVAGRFISGGNRVRIVAHDEGGVVGRYLSGDIIGSYDHFVEGELVPIRTPEQIAEEEREKECEAMLKIATSRLPNPDVYQAIGALYDAGYRKVGDA